MDPENKSKSVEYPISWDFSNETSYYLREGEVTYRHFPYGLKDGNHIRALVSGEVEVVYFTKYKDHDPIIRRIILYAHNWQEDIRKLINYWNSGSFSSFKFSTNHYDL